MLLHASNVNIQMTCHSIGGAVCVAVALLIVPCVLAQNLFVVMDNTNIAEFTPDGTQSTFASGLGLPGGLAFNKTGDLFVADFIPPGNIYEYTPNGVQIASVSVPGIPFALAFNSAGDLFVSVVTSTNNAIVKLPRKGHKASLPPGRMVSH